jgi:hypothetical protein
MGATEIEKVKLLQQKSKDWLDNYKKYGLATDPVASKQYKQITVVLDKCKKILEKEAKKTVSKAEIGSVQVSETAKKLRAAEKLKEQELKSFAKETSKDTKKLLKDLKKDDKKSALNTEKIEDALERFKDIAVLFVENNIDDILKGIEKFDKAVLKRAQEFISKAEAFIKIAAALGDDALNDKIKKVEGWIAAAKRVIEMVNAVDKYLKMWRDISVDWMEKGVKDVVSGVKIIGNISNVVITEASDLKKTLDNFINEAKKFGDASLDEKIKKAEDWLKSTNTVLDKAGAIVNDIFKDADKNSLPDWYDLLSHEWDKLAVKDLIPGKLDEAIFKKLDAFKLKVDEWVKKASAELSPALKDKLDKAKLWLNNIQTLIDLSKKGKEFVDDLKNKDFNAVYDKLKSMWSELDKTDDIFAGTDIDNKLLDKLKELKSKAENFASLANSLIKKLPGGEKLGDVEIWIKKAMEIATEMAKGEDVIGNYLELAKQWAEGEIKKVVDGAKELTAEAAAQVSGFVNEVKKFMAAASTMKKGNLADKITAAGDWIKSSESILDKASDLIGLALADTDKNNLPDWYDKLSKSWDKILNGKDLIPGMDFDDALLGKLNIFKTEAEKWLAQAVGKEALLKDKIETVRQWIDTGSKFLKEVGGFVQDIKDGDMLSIYEKIKNGWAALGKTNDILRGTTIDNKILDKAKELKEDAEAWIANALSGGKADGKMTEEVKNILSLADDFLTLILTKYKIEDHLQDFQEDEIVITDPQGRVLNQAQINDLIGEFSGGMDGSVKNQLIAVINKINQEMVSLCLEIDAAYRKTIASGSEASNVYLTAKKDFESVMKKQKQVEQLLEKLRKIVVGVITTALIPVNPAVAAIVGGLLSGALTDFTKLVGFLGKTASENSGGTVGQIGGLIAALLPSTDNSALSNAETEGLIDLNNLFNTGVTQKYEEVKIFVSKLQKELDNIYKGLYKLNQDGLDKTKSSVATAADKWKNLNGQIQDKYINAKNTRINKKAAYWLLSRAQYASWLNTKKDTMIVDEVIDALTRFKIMQEAGVEWNKGAGGDVAKSLGWLFGGWASFGYDKKVKALNSWASGEISRLQNPAAWQGAFG